MTQFESFVKTQIGNRYNKREVRKGMDTRIRDLREDKDWNQKDVAAALKLPRNTYRNYELGIRTIPLEILVEIAKLHKTSTDYILKLSDIKAPYRKN